MEREKILYDWEKDEKKETKNPKIISESTNEDAMVRMLAERRREQINNEDNKKMEAVINRNHSEKNNRNIETQKPLPQKNIQVRKSSGVRQQEMIKKSTDGKITSNKRSKTKVKRNWKNIAITVSLSVMLASSMTAGGLLADPIEKFTDNLESKWQLEQMQDDFLHIVDRYTTPTFANDEIVNYHGIASYLDKDGQFTNQELYTAVDTLGEVETNRIIQESKYSNTSSVEEYMKDNNIKSMKDWEKKTIKEMTLKKNIEENARELDKIFVDEPIIINEEHQVYGGK